MEKRIETKHCDRCGQTMDVLVSDNQMITYDVVEVTADGRATLDLCPVCKHKLYRWIYRLDGK